MLDSKALTIGTTSVRQVGELYSLNDLHKASGGEVKHQPGYFMRRDETKDLVAELEGSPEMVNSGNSANSQSYQTKEGRGGGTYACKELVIAYAAWISAAFHLKVIRVFLAQMASAAAPLNPAINYDRISPAQAQDLKEIVEAIVKAGVQGFGETWARLQRKFKVNSYLELPATQHLDARKYLIAKLPKGYDGTVVGDEPAEEGKRLVDASTLDKALAMASEVAAVAHRHVMNAVLQGDEPQGFGERWVFMFNLADPRMSRGNGFVQNGWAKRIAHDVIMESPKNLADSIRDFRLELKNHDLAEIASACAQRLAKRMQSEASTPALTS